MQQSLTVKIIVYAVSFRINFLNLSQNAQVLSFMKRGTLLKAKMKKLNLQNWNVYLLDKTANRSLICVDYNEQTSAF